MSKHILLKELQSKYTFPDEEFPKLLALFKEKHYKKNEIMFKAGDVVKHTYFIIKDCIRQYYVSPEGSERIIYFAEEGAFTGETSVLQLKAVGGTHTLIGHSERRQYFGETDEIVNKKLHTALKHGVVPIVCIGEVLEEREAGKTADVLKTQVTGAFAAITAEAAASIVIAYEPVWAIGTGKTATPEMAAEAHAIIRVAVGKLLGAEIATKMRILYGGSVKPENARALIGQEEIDGALVGGASLKPDSFAAIVKY